MRNIILILSFLFAVPALASEAEETLTLTTSAAVTVPCVNIRVVMRTVKRVSGGAEFATHCYAGGKFLPGTVTWFRVGKKLSGGATGTLIKGHVIDNGDPAKGSKWLGFAPKDSSVGECSVTPANMRSYVKASGVAGAADSLARGVKEVMKRCVGGT